MPKPLTFERSFLSINEPNNKAKVFDLLSKSSLRRFCDINDEAFNIFYNSLLSKSLNYFYFGVVVKSFTQEAQINFFVKKFKEIIKNELESPHILSTVTYFPFCKDIYFEIFVNNSDMFLFEIYKEKYQKMLNDY